MRAQANVSTQKLVAQLAALKVTTCDGKHFKF
jgi:hypothetical protein